MATVVFFDKFLKNQNDGTHAIDFDTDVIRVALITTAFSATTCDFFNDLTELAGAGGYTTAGTVVTMTPTLDTTNHRWDVDASDTAWTFTSAKTFRYAVFYHSAATTATSPLIAYSDLGSQTVTGTFNLNLSDSYLFRFAK